MQFPINLRFKILAVSSQIFAIDSTGNTIFYVKQKLFKLKENIEIFTDSTKSVKLFTVKADRIIDFSPEFTLYDSKDMAIGSVKRFGKKSIWRSYYEIKIGSTINLNVEEINPWAKVADSFFAAIPFVGAISGYIFQPKYSIIDKNANQQVTTLEKLPAFFEGKYQINTLNKQYDDKTQLMFTALLMVVVLRERLRG